MGGERAGQQQAAWVGTTLNSFFTQVFAASGSLCSYTLQVPSSCSWSELSCQLLRQAFADILSETPPGCWLDQELQKLGICASCRGPILQRLEQPAHISLIKYLLNK